MKIVFRSLILFVLTFFTIQAWGVVIAPESERYQYDQARVAATGQSYSYDTVSNLFAINESHLSESFQGHSGNGLFFAFVDGFVAAKRTTQSRIGVTRHSVHQKINRQVRSADELDAIKNPLDVRPVKVDKLGRPSQRSIGRKAEVARNPDTGDIVSVNPTSTKKAERLLRRQGGQ